MSVSTPFVRAAVQLGLGIQRAAGVRGTYIRGNDQIDGIIGTPGRIDPSGDVIEDVAALDIDSCWIFTAEDLIVSTLETVVDNIDSAQVIDRFGNWLTTRENKHEPLIPIEGDYWLFTRDDGGEEVYRVLPPYQQQYCWSYMDPLGTMIRVFTKNLSN